MGSASPKLAVAANDAVSGPRFCGKCKTNKVTSVDHFYCSLTVGETCVEKNTWFQDDLIETQMADNILDCQFRCAEHNDCIFYTYRESDGECKLRRYASVAAEVEESGYHSGAGSCNYLCKKTAERDKDNGAVAFQCPADFPYSYGRDSKCCATPYDCKGKAMTSESTCCMGKSIHCPQGAKMCRRSFGLLHLVCTLTIVVCRKRPVLRHGHSVWHFCSHPKNG